MADAVAEELLALNQKLLDAIAGGDWATYTTLCDPTLTCIEPEARGQVVAGMAFHKYYFDLGAGNSPRQNTMASPQVRVMGDVALLAYVRLTQRLDAHGHPQTAAVEETRVWHKQQGAWKHVHFHRSVVE
ncbi:MAG: nuclear transport factor 2 family protein [Pirellulales bacterium]|nr:nuclear transport factor 2 family protein [Pirellulales bacterium]